jgi:hypothetical protein
MFAAPGLLIAMLLASTVVGAPLPVGRYVYEGTIAGKPVLLRLRCGVTCSGSYIYENVGEPLRLAPAGPNELDESVGTGDRVRRTGHLAFTTPPGGSSWQGVWTPPASASAASTPSAQAIRLQRVLARAVPRAIPRKLHVQSPRDRDCHVDVRSFEITGLADLALEDRLNDFFDPEHQARGALVTASTPRAEIEETCGTKGELCDESTLGYRLLCRSVMGERGGLFFDADIRVALLDAQLLSARDEYGFDGGGAHPSDGVGGVTFDLRDGHLLDARDLLRHPEHEPAWSSRVTHPPPASDGIEEMPLAIGTRDDAHVDLDDGAWSDFYLTPHAVALVPIVPEAARVYRHQVQLVHYARVRRALRPDGPAAHLYR